MGFLHSSSILISVGIVSVLMGSDEVPWSERGEEIESNTAHHGDTLPTLHITHRSSLVSLQHSIASQSTAQHSTAHHSTAQHSTAQHSTAQHSTAQHSTASQSTPPHSTAHHTTPQHSTA